MLSSQAAVYTVSSGFSLNMCGTGVVLIKGQIGDYFWQD